MLNIEQKPEKVRTAVALRYEADRDGIPVVIAKGRGELAERIIGMARANDIHIEEDSQLAEALTQVEIDQRIPKELYKAVAVILGFVLRQRAKAI